MITEIVAHLVTKLKENKSVNDFFADFTEASVSWLRPLFLKEDGQPNENITKLADNPDSVSRKKLIESMVEVALDEKPESKPSLEEMFKILQNKEDKKIWLRCGRWKRAYCNCRYQGLNGQHKSEQARHATSLTQLPAACPTTPKSRAPTTSSYRM
ncbi:MAG: hypothetical protein IPJ00_16420 [Saprospirales bacterium]|nr:hypothetical protein [Saprospirales bacterium]